MKAYENPQELAHLQQLCVKILAEFDRVCTLLDIPYMAYGGTAIGAVRHKGFIPWDDDVDIALLRPDYERFIAEAPEVLGEEFELVGPRTDKYFPATNINLALKDTRFIPEEFMSCRFSYPIGIGIYALDVLTDDEALYRKQVRRCWLYARLKFLTATSRPYVPFGGAKRALVYAACSIAHGLLRLFHVSPAWLQRKWEEAAEAADDQDTGVYCDFADRNPRAWALSHDEMFPLVRMPFDGIEVSMPCAYDAVLRRGYGDYMEFPPPEQRKNHYPGVLDFGPYPMR